MDLLRELESLVVELEKGLNRAFCLSDLEELRIDFLGRKGRLAQLMANLSSIEPSLRPPIGKKANEVKESLNSLFDKKKSSIEALAESDYLQRFDPTLPGRQYWQGSLHPISLLTEEICAIFQSLGYEVVSGPEVELDYYNFEALNMPAEHPARDMQDTLYISKNLLMRTHTSPVQVRTMLKQKPPLAIIVPGKVYRRDSDITHTPMFHQIEGLFVGQKVSMAQLRGTLTVFLQKIFGAETKVRFRPSFFPFTEPSAEVDISCRLCDAKGYIGLEPCRVCKTTGWVEILGCGMVDPAVFDFVGYDSEEITGFAFGLGVERVAMLKYGIGDLRMFFENDIRFLSQFA